jgi:N-acetylneuraminate synthase
VPTSYAEDRHVAGTRETWSCKVEPEDVHRETKPVQNVPSGAVRFVAEVSSNHTRSLERALAFVDAAAEVGFDAVKFQLFRVRELFAPEVLAASAAHRAREAWELPEAFVPALAERARARGVSFGCTPFHLGAVEVLRGSVDFLKVASYELLWDDLLVACAKTRMPLVLSTGMATAEEVSHACEVVVDAGCSELVLLHCVSAYPTPPGITNLRAIETLRALAPSRPGLAVRTGWSDHSADPAVVMRAIHRFGAEMIEMHFDLDGYGPEFAPGHCWLPSRAAELIRMARVGLACDGDGRKAPSPDEWEERAWRADPSDGLRPLLAMRRGRAA